MFTKALGRIYYKVQVICKEREDPSLGDDIHLDLVRTIEGEIYASVFTLSTTGILGWVTLCCQALLCNIGCAGATLAATTPHLQLC